MAALRYISKNKLFNYLSEAKSQLNINCRICAKFLSYTPKIYDGNPDPGPIFINKEVQLLLKSLTRVNVAKVYQKRKTGAKYLEPPVYKFMTDKELQESIAKINEQIDEMIQFPPILSVRKPINRILSQDPALQGLETSKLVFTDITYGIRDSERLIVVRELDGTLREADWDVKERINQVYFPTKHHSLKLPRMFEDNYFEDVLNRKEYIFILDRACLQFQPDDPLYQKIITITYQHINDTNSFDVLRSTRHFSGLAFFLAWNKMIDNLLLDLIETGHVDEINCLVQLYGRIHQKQFESDGHLKSLEEFIKASANKKGALELAVQAYKDLEKQKSELDGAVKSAHGFN